MEPAAQREFIRDNMDADLQFILGESGVTLGTQVAIARHYGSLRKFSALGDDRASIRTSCLQDFAIPGDTPESRAQTASVVAAWETAREYMAKEVELKAEAKVLGQPRVLQIHERQAMIRAVEAVHGSLNDSETLSSDYLSIKAEESECNEPTAAPLDEILSKHASANSQIQSAVDSSGHIRVTRTKTKSKMPSSTEEYRKVMKVEMYAWLCMASRYKAKHWLHGLTATPFLKFTEFILGDRVYGLQIPSSSQEGTSQQKVRPDWTVILAFEYKLRKEAMKRVQEGHTLADALEAVIKDPDLKEAYFTTPMALRASMPESQPYKYQRFGNKGGFGGFNNKGNFGSSFGKGKGKNVKGKSKGCEIAASFRGFFILEHPEDLGTVQGEQPGSIWQWDELLDLIPKLNAVTFAIHQCMFGGLTPKPTRFLTNLHVDDKRCYMSLPKFDKSGFYVGPLPRFCGHEHSHKLIGKTASKWNTAPSASYPPGLCRFLASIILSCGGGSLKNAGTSASSSGNAQLGHRKRDVIQASLEQPAQKKQRTLEKGESPFSADKGESSSSAPLAECIRCDSRSDERECEAVPKPAGDVEQTVASEQFDMAACCNSGRPIEVEWDQKQRGFVDGFGLCSPCRWKPSRRGARRTPSMVKLADDTFQILAQAVQEAIGDVRREAFKLVTGKLVQSPFSEDCLKRVRSKWFQLLKDPGDAALLDEGQPFFLRALSQWLTQFEDPDAFWLVDAEDSFATGVYVGVGRPLPRSPQVFPPKLKHRKLDPTGFQPIADNYASAQVSAKELEEKFLEEEALGRMHPSKVGILRQEYGDNLRIASMAAITKPDGSVRPLHDATHSVMVNHEILYQDKIDCPGPAEIASIVREATETMEAPFCVSADIKAAHRLVKVRRADWGFLCCRADSTSDTVWVNHTGTFGVSSAPFWWAKLAGLLGRFVGYMFHQRWMMQMIYVDDLHGVFVGPQKFLFLWIWVLAYELAGTPFGYHKFKGGYASEFVGFHIRYDQAEVGISVKRGDWLMSWIKDVRTNRYVVTARDFAEFLGRLGFISQLITWLKPRLAPLFAWSAVTAKGTVGRLPDTIIITLEYIEAELAKETYLVSTKRPVVLPGERFRTDAKCTDTYVVLAGWEMETGRWFSLRLSAEQVPFLFKPDRGSQWASTSAELLATLTALHTFGWLAPCKERKTLDVIFAGTDNSANESLSVKRSTTKWPLMGINMQLSSSLAAARLTLGLRWRPREQNTEADQLTNEDYTGFSEDLRVLVSWDDLDLPILKMLLKTRDDFVEAREREKEVAKRDPQKTKKRFDKTPW
eukprot:s1843_g15.t1